MTPTLKHSNVIIQRKIAVTQDMRFNKRIIGFEVEVEYDLLSNRINNLNNL